MIENATETDAVWALDRAPFLPDDHVENRIIAMVNKRMAVPPFDFLPRKGTRKEGTTLDTVKYPEYTAWFRERQAGYWAGASETTLTLT